MSPLGIEIMLHHYAFAGPYGRECGNGHCPGDAPAVIEEHAQLRLDGMLDGNNMITDRGRAYVDFLKAVPVPICRWQLP